MGKAGRDAISKIGSVQGPNPRKESSSLAVHSVSHSWARSLGAPVSQRRRNV